MSDKNKIIAEEIASKRKAKGLTQLQMAEKIAEMLNTNYSSRQYQNIEEGKFPKYKTQIVETIDDILGGNFYDKIYENSGNANILNDTETPEYVTRTKELNPERALIDLLLLEMAKVKSKLYGVSIEDAIDELEKNARIALRQIEKGGA